MEEKSPHEKRKKRIFEIIEASHANDLASHVYDIMILVCVVVGLLPLTIKVENPYSRMIDFFTAIIFLFDYCARLFTADYKMGIKCTAAYVAYFLSPLAIIDLLSIIPVLALFFPTNNTIALFRIFRIFRVLKLIRYSKTMRTIENVLRKVKNQLFAVLLLVLVYIVATAMFMFQIEPDLFGNFFDALYWSTVSITTIGYGDITPQTTIGQFITMISSLVGMAVIALPTGIITAAYTDELKRVKGKHEL